MLTCPFCGTENRSHATYCNSCGGLLVSGSAAPPHTQTAPPRATQTHAPAHPTGRLPAQTLLAGRYLILKPVGQGGMAAVYRATDTRKNRPVAIKEMSQDGLSPEEIQEALDSFRFEADTLTRLRHPNLPLVYERFSEGARHYLVMEFIEGQTLEQRQVAAGGAGLPETDVMAWASQLCAVLGYLHRQSPPIIFRDLKPANVMLTPKGQVKLIDFGIARYFAPGRTKDTQVLGTPGFAPPEQYGKTQTDPRADIYALGCTLYQLLTGYDPATTPFALPPLYSRSPQVSTHIGLAIERATKLDRDARYRTMEEFANALLRPDALYFRSGTAARDTAQLVDLCQRYPQEAEYHLYGGRVEGWLRAWGNKKLADAAAKAVRNNTSRSAGLAAFLAVANGITTQRGPTGPIPTWGASPRTTAKHAAAPGNASTTRAAASATATTQSAAAILVQPKTVSMGPLIAGQRGTQTLTIGGMHGERVSGTIISHSPWLVIDRGSFDGASTLLTVSVETSRMSGAGTAASTLQITSGRQHLYVPVKVEVRAASGAPPRQKTASAQPKGKKPVPGKYLAPEPVARRIVRILSSLFLSFGLALALLLAASRGIAQVPVLLPYAPYLAGVAVVLAALVTVPGAVLAAGRPGWAGRNKTALGGALLGLAIALAVAGGPILQAGAQLLAHGIQAPHLILLLAAGAPALGAALGADARFGRLLQAAGRLIRRYATLCILLGAIVLGGWGGFLLGASVLYGLLAPAGLVVGAILGALIARRVNRLVRRWQTPRIHTVRP